MIASSWSLAPLAALAVSAPAYAAQYMTAEQAMRLAFPGADTFAPRRISLRPERWSLIDRESPALVAAREPRSWTASAGDTTLGHFYVDEVLGKQLYITYGTAIAPDGAVLRVEILEYRETHGYEVRNSRWLAQFAGKDSTGKLELGRDIKNISGATLSCRHVTEGVRRLLAIHQAQQHGL